MEPSFRLATPGELEPILGLYAAARAFMRAAGNPTQWPEGYPPRESVAEDIARGTVYVAEEAGELLAVFTYEIGREPFYDKIDGAWRSDAETYGFMHRLATAKQGKGIGAACIEFCRSHVPILRIDTHADNLPLQRLLARLGFRPCGIVDYGEAGTRLAFEWG